MTVMNQKQPLFKMGKVFKDKQHLTCESFQQLADGFVGRAFVVQPRLFGPSTQERRRQAATTIQSMSEVC